jgi:hypothetical protein
MWNYCYSYFIMYAPTYIIIPGAYVTRVLQNIQHMLAEPAFYNAW